ncbi:MAG TPA: diacylglycerol kinase family protein [Candidatus Acidoferrum sp.]|nr:diacylglycerol kinase family protein [Candidatus Acidoferrum sp.]
MAEFSIASHEFPAVVFVNPHAGGGRARRCLSPIKRIFAERSFPAEFIFTESTEALESHARRAIQAGQRVLLAMGGDGTLQALVNAAHGHDVVLGILPAGGGNDFAVALGLPKNPIAAATASLSAKPRLVDLLRARTADGRRRLYVGGGGVGLDADAARYSGGAYARLPGRLRYIAAALRALREFKPLQVRAEFPRSEIPAMDAQVLLAGVLNTPSYGAGLRLAPDNRIDDGLLTTLFVKNLSAAEVLAVVPRLLTRGDLPSSHVTRAFAPRVRLTTDRECFFHGDGEILGCAPVEIEVLPNAARMLTPVTT